MDNFGKITIGIVATLGICGIVYIVYRKKNASVSNPAIEPMPPVGMPESCLVSPQPEPNPTVPAPKPILTSPFGSLISKHKINAGIQNIESSSIKGNMYVVENEDISKSLFNIIRFMKLNGGNSTDIENLESLYNDAVKKNSYVGMEKALFESLKSIQFWARSFPNSNSIRYFKLMSQVTKPIKPIQHKIEVLKNTNLMLQGMFDLLAQVKQDKYYNN